jgi:hypothetical protein
MGGTGVGKSTLLNALAGEAIAKAAFTRPTTRDPVVYVHESIRTDRLDPLLRQCKLASHDREELRQKILVDTPDVDSNDLANRERLLQLLPVADVVLYVGSQEKYHDQLVWDLFKGQRKRRGFAFVLNKWDRCLIQADGAATRPDEDLLRDLRAEGFEQPLLFRVTAQAWIDARAAGRDAPEQPTPGEQFSELVDWLERRLTAQEIEAIKARGVGQLFAQLEPALESAAPPDLSNAVGKVIPAWERTLTAEARDYTQVLLGTLDPYRAEIEQHFREEGHKRFTGLYAGYQSLLNGMRTAGSSLRDRVPFLGKPREPLAVPVTWNAAAFTSEASRVALDRALGRRVSALGQRLLVEADGLGMPMAVLESGVTEAGRINWQQRFDRALREALADVEAVWNQPRGVSQIVPSLTLLAANTLPALAFLGSWLVVLWRFFLPEAGYQTQWIHLALPFVILLVVLVILQFVIGLVMPMHWPAIRSEFEDRLDEKVRTELIANFRDVPTEAAEGLRQEREAVLALRDEVRELAEWLSRHERAAQVADLYGNVSS